MIGSFEQLVLLAVLRLGDGAYGMAIRDEIGERTRRGVSLGAVYATLDRLAAKGLLSVTDGPGGGERRGRPRKFFVVERSGRDALAESLDGLERMLSGLPRRRLRRGLG